jgi:hypothetical protein
MNLTEMFIAQLDSEAKKTRTTLERVPEGKADWKPHAKSMPLGRLAMLVAHMPSWISLIIKQDELDVVPKPGAAPSVSMKPLNTGAELVKAMDDDVTAAKDALKGTTDAHLMTHWKLLAAGKVVGNDPRYIVIRDTFAHLAHHRAQLGIYLRLNDVAVPSVYGPSADDQTFA